MVRVDRTCVVHTWASMCSWWGRGEEKSVLRTFYIMSQSSQPQLTPATANSPQYSPLQPGQPSLEDEDGKCLQAGTHFSCIFQGKFRENSQMLNYCWSMLISLKKLYQLSKLATLNLFCVCCIFIFIFSSKVVYNWSQTRYTKILDFKTLVDRYQSIGHRLAQRSSSRSAT